MHSFFFLSENTKPWGQTRQGKLLLQQLGNFASYHSAVTYSDEIGYFVWKQGKEFVRKNFFERQLI